MHAIATALRRMSSEPSVRWWTVRGYARLLKMRIGHPPLISKKGCAVSEMPVGRGGYISEIAVDGEGQLCTKTDGQA